MTAPKHTPRPWRVIIDDTGGPNSGWPLCISADDDEDKTVVRQGGQWPYEWDAAMSQREAVANAHLIATAPDLLDALKGAIGALEFSQDFHRDLGNEDQAFAADRLDAARAAIAKATGQ